MKKPTNRIAFTAKFISHATIVSWRLMHGRLYIFRDQPQWFVIIVAQVQRMLQRLSTKDRMDRREEYPYAFALGDQAREEIRTRYIAHMKKKYPLWPDTHQTIGQVLEAMSTSPSSTA